MSVKTIRPPLGAKVLVRYSEADYPGRVLSYDGPLAKVKFRFRNGKTLQRVASIFPAMTPDCFQLANTVFATYS